MAKISISCVMKVLWSVMRLLCADEGHSVPRFGRHLFLLSQ